MRSLVRSLGSVTLGNAVEKGLGALKLVLVTAWLGPSEFGVYALALVVMMTMDQLTQVGFESALIEKEAIDRGDKDTAWLLLLARGLVLGALTWSLSPSIAAFFGEPRLAWPIRIVAVVLVLNGAQSIEFFLARRSLRFGPWVAVRLWGSVVDFALSLALAWWLRSAWALVLAFAFGALVRMVVGYIAAPFSPRLSFDARSMTHLLRFGRWAGGLSIVLFLLTQGDDLFVGKAIGVTALGLYQLAYKISNMPTSEVTHVMSNVTLPIYARLKNAGKHVGDAFLTVIALTAFATLPTALAVAFFARPFVAGLLGPEWSTAVPLMQLLAVWGVTRSFDASAGSLFFAMGRPDLDFRFHAVKLAVLVALIFPLSVAWDTLGVAAAVVVSGIVASPVTMRAALSLVGVGWSRFAATLRAPLVVTAFFGVLFAVIRGADTTDVAALAVGAVTFVVVAASAGILVWKYRVVDVSHLATAYGGDP